MHRADFHASACTTSRWLCWEIMKTSWVDPLLMQTAGCKSKPPLFVSLEGALSTAVASGSAIAIGDATFRGAVCTAAVCAEAWRAVAWLIVTSSIETEDHDVLGGAVRAGD